MAQPILFPIAGVHLNTAGTGIRKRGVAPNFCGGRLRPTAGWTLSGITKDSTGAALAGCTVSLYRTTDDRLMEKVISDGSGAYRFSTIGLSETYYVVAYKPGSPDVAGTTRNDLVGA